MSASEWLQIIGLAALLGVVGQAARFLVGTAGAGLATVTKTSFAVTFGTAILVGSAAGVVAAIAANVQASNISSDTVVALIAAGYTGTDVIDQFVSRLGVANGRTITPTT